MFKKTLYISLLLSIFLCVNLAKKEFTPVLNDFVKEYTPLFLDEGPLSIKLIGKRQNWL
jgi:hypothetical protein